MGGIRPWRVDDGPANNASKDIQLLLSAAKNERVPNVLFMADIQLDSAAGAFSSAPTLAEEQALLNKFIFSAKLIVGGKTLWTLDGSELFALAMHKSRTLLEAPGLDSQGFAVPLRATVTRICIPFYFNQPITKYPSILAPGAAQLYQQILTWTRGDGTATFQYAGRADTLVTCTNVELVASFGFEKGYYVAPMAFIDKINLANTNTPIPGGFIPNVVSKTDAVTLAAAVGRIVSYSTPYGEEIHNLTPTKVAVAFGENGGTDFASPENLMSPIKFLPSNAEVDDFLPSPNGENMEVTTADASKTLLVERYVDTNQFIAPVVASLGPIAAGKEWVVTGLPGIPQSTVPNEYVPYLPKKLAT